MLKKGSPVIVKDAWKYNGRFLGCVGIIHHFYTSRGRMAGPQVAILFEDVRNPESSDGLFWFPADNIVLASSYSKNKLAQQTKNYMTEEVNINDMKAQIFGGKTAHIRFLNGTNQNKTYEYALYDDLKAGDTVVVQTGHHGKTVAVIDEVIDQPPINVAYNREVICLVDMTAYEERQRRVQRMRELKAQMDDRVRQLRNIAIVWALTGIWHGASWNFLLWGLYFGVLLILEKLFLLRLLEKAPSFVRHLYALVLILIGWVLFAFDDLSRGVSYLGAMFGAGGSLLSDQTVYLFYTNVILLVVLAIASAGVPGKLRRWYGRFSERRPIPQALLRSVGIAAVLLLSTAYLVDASYNPFLYFRF